MKNLFTLLAVLSLFTFSSCQDDDDAAIGNIEVAVDFRSEFNGEDLAISSATYLYPTGAELKMLLFQYYVSDLELLPADGGAAVRLADVELIRYQSATEDAVDSRTYTIPAGDYSGMRFGLGVSADLNAMDPGEFAADFALNESTFWNANARYVFAKIEANADLENDGTFDTGLSYHMGSDALYTTVTFTGDFTLDGNNDPRLTVIADVLKALSGNGETFDIANPDQQAVHGGNQAIAQSIWERLAGQFELELR